MEDAGLGMLKQIAVLLLAFAEGFFRLLTLGDVAERLDGPDDLAVRIAQRQPEDRRDDVITIGNGYDGNSYLLMG